MLSDKLKILIAEDDKILDKILKNKLEKEGFLITIVNNGNDIFSKLKELNPDIMLLDVMLPGKNGFEVLEEMKLKNEFRNIPVMIISNLSQDSDIKKGRELGAIDYLVKSDLSIVEVINRVKEILNRLKEAKIAV